jgi:hypothetical protein
MLDQARHAAAAGTEVDAGWPAPDLTLLGGPRDDPPPFPAEVLPPFWRDWCQQTARGAGVPVDYVGLALLTVAAGLLGGARYISPVPAWVEPCVLWTALVGAPSSGKTPGMATALRLVRNLNDDLAAENEAQRRRHVTARETARAEGWWWREELRGAVANRRPSPQMPAAADAPQPFAPRRLLVEDPAIDIVTDALVGSPRGILLAGGALDGWLGGVTPDGDSTLAFWLKAWSAGPWAVRAKGGRAGAPIACAAVSILGTLEPDTIARTLIGHDDGIGARLLFGWPGRKPFQLLSGAMTPRHLDARQALARLRDLPDGPRVVPLAPAARTLFDDFRRLLHAEVDALDDAEAAWWGNGASTVLRLAGLWSFLDWAVRPDGAPEPPDIPADALDACIVLWHGHLWPHARSVLGSTGGSERRRQTRKALLWILRHDLPEVSRDDLWRHARAARDAPGVDHVIATLVDAGCLRPLDPGPGRGRPRLRWAVNPALSGVDWRDV